MTPLRLAAAMRLAASMRPGRAATEAGPGSMTYTQSALWPYLYGHRVEWEKIDGRLLVRAVRTESHSFGEKTIPSGFLSSPGRRTFPLCYFRTRVRSPSLTGWA